MPFAHTDGVRGRVWGRRSECGGMAGARSRHGGQALRSCGPVPGDSGDVSASGRLRKAVAQDDTGVLAGGGLDSGGLFLSD